MADRRLPASGEVVAGRYELMERVSEHLGSSTWRARDRVLNRNVGIEALAADDPRAGQFLAAARASTVVVDPHFLRVLDVLEDAGGFALVIREWARAFSLDQLLRHGTLPNRRAATIVGEVAAALAHAHEQGVHHRRLTPRQVQVKQSGAVRIVGLGVAYALSPSADETSDVRDPEQEDVRDLGRLLYACLAGRWPGGPVDGLRAAPTDHGTLLRPRQVVAGVSRDVDTVCDRILGDPPRHGESPLRSARSIAYRLSLAGEDIAADDQPSLVHTDGADLLRIDPVVVPVGPPPGLEPPRRRPKAFEPAPPTPLERGRARARRFTRGDRALVLVGVLVTLLICSVIGGLVVGRTGGDGALAQRRSAPVTTLDVTRVDDLDPQGQDKAENPELAPLAVDGDEATGWRTSQYFGAADFAGLKDGVGLVLDLGRRQEITAVSLRFARPGTSFSLYTSSTQATMPTSRVGMRLVAARRDAAGGVRITLDEPVLSRYVVVWLTRVPEVSDGTFQGEIREVVVRGRS